MAKGYTQVEGIDYNETFSLITKMVIVKSLLAITAAKSLKIHQINVNNIFLDGDLLKEVYMDLPMGYIQTNDSPKKVFKAIKSIALRFWWNNNIYGFCDFRMTQIFTYISFRQSTKTK